MQLAARRVAWENTQLREMLASKGVSPGEIEGFLRGQEQMRPRVPSNTVASGDSQGGTAVRVNEIRLIEPPRIACSTDLILRQTWGKGIGAGEQEDSRSSTRMVEGQVIAKTPGGELNEEVPLLGSPAREPLYVDRMRDPKSASDKFGCDASDRPSAVDAERNSILPTVSDCFCSASSTASSFTKDDLMLEMSCETAASIISGMRGNGDREQARSQLGCEGGEHCNVKNIKVLQVMEMD